METKQTDIRPKPAEDTENVEEKKDPVSAPVDLVRQSPAWTDGRSGSDAAFPWKKTIVEGVEQP